MDLRKSFVPMKGAMPAPAKPQYGGQARVRLRPGSGTARHQGCPFTQALYDEARDKGWIIISMKDDWSRVFSFEGAGARALE